MIYQKLFFEYHKTAAQVLLTFDVVSSDERRHNAINTFNELLQLDVVPVVNENDTVGIDELDDSVTFGDNDTLSAIVASMIHADLLIILTDIDGLYTDDPHTHADAKLIHVVEEIDDNIKSMAKGAMSSYGTGGMSTKIAAARIATNSNTDMAIVSGADLNNINRLLHGEDIGTLFLSHKEKDFNVEKFILSKEYLE